MKKRKMWIPLIVLLVLWLGMFATDYRMSTTLRKPVFVVPVETADDGGSGTYQGLGYSVTLELNGNVPNSQVISVTMEMFGKVIGASIT